MMRSRNVNRTTSVVQELPPLGAKTIQRENIHLRSSDRILADAWRYSWLSEMVLLHRRDREETRLEALVSIDHCYAVLASQASAREFRDRWRSGRFANRVELFRETLRDWIRTQSNVGSRLFDDLRTELEQSGTDLYHGHGQFRDERIRAVRSRQSSPTNTNRGDRFASMVRKQIGAGYIGCETDLMLD